MIFRVMKLNNYTVIANNCIRNHEISLKAKGLHTLMMSLPDDWNYSMSGLKAMCKENDRSIENALAELKTHGYLKVEKKPPTPGHNKFHYIYSIYEVPYTEIEDGKFAVEVHNVPLESPPVEVHSVGVHSVGVHSVGVHSVEVQNRRQINTNKLNTNKLNTNKLNTEDKEPEKAKTGYDLILELYNTLCPSLPKAKSMNYKRKRAVKQLSSAHGVGDFKTVFSNAEQSNFCKGRSSSGSWRGADLDWLLDENHFTRTLEGRYNDSKDTPDEIYSGMTPTENLSELERRLMAEYES